MRPLRFSIATLRGTAGLIATLTVAGCVSVPNVSANKDSLAKTKHITLLAPHEPPVVQVVNIGGVAMAFGAVGGLMQGLQNIDNSKDFLDAMTKRKVSLKEPLQADLVSALQRDGFVVDVDAKQWPKKAADGKSDDYSGLHVDSDAILLVWFGVAGYMSSAGSLHYEPMVTIRARLIDAKTKQDLYFKTFCVGYKAKVKDAVKLPADPQYRFVAFDSLMAHVDKAVAGLVDCEARAARQIATDLASTP